MRVFGLRFFSYWQWNRNCETASCNSTIPLADLPPGISEGRIIVRRDCEPSPEHRWTACELSNGSAEHRQRVAEGSLGLPAYVDNIPERRQTAAEDSCRLPARSHNAMKRSCGAAERSRNATERSRNMAERFVLLPERSVALCERSVALPERSFLLPERSGMLSTRSAAFFRRSVMLLEGSGRPCEHSVVFLERSFVLRERSTSAFDRSFVLLAIDGHQSSGSLGLDLRPSLPAERLQGAEEGDAVRLVSEETDNVVLVELFGKLRENVQHLVVEGAAFATGVGRRPGGGDRRSGLGRRLGLGGAPGRLELLDLGAMAGLEEAHGLPEMIVQGLLALLEFVAGHLLHCSTRGACVASQSG